MNAKLLVAPVSVDSTGRWFGAWNRLVVGVLRVVSRTSRLLVGGRGVGLSCALAARAMSRHGEVRFRLSGGGVFIVGVRDGYWLVPLLLTGEYEPDLDAFLGRCLTAEDVFLDCGANLGLWSIATSRVISSADRVVAIEASSSTFLNLQKNLVANDESFTAMSCAVGDTSGDHVAFFASPSDHAAASVFEDLSPSDSQRETVQTVSLRDLVETQSQPVRFGLTFAKLDIEGNECRALSSLPLVADGRLVILFEDHGRDAAHSTASFLLERGWIVAFISDNGSIERILIERIERLGELKSDRNRGYNLVAFARSGAAAERIGERYPELSVS